MRVVSIKHLEDCFDGSFIKEVLLDQEIDKETILNLGQDGNLKYYQDFTRPYFKIVRTSCYELKGVEGNKSMRIHLKNPSKYSIEDFIDLINNFLV